MTEASHSKFSASAAARWLSCPGSMVLSVGKPDSSSCYAAEGTCAHLMLERCVDGMLTLCDRTWIGEVHDIDGHRIEVSADMLDHVDTVVGNLREMLVNADTLTSESRVNYSGYLGVPEHAGWGTADVIAIVGTELQVHDLKYGMGVEVSAEHNEQMLLYAAGALAMYDGLVDIHTVRLVIHQPRIVQAPSEWSLPVEELHKWLSTKARAGATSVQVAEKTWRGQVDAEWQTAFLNPTEKGCRWCKAKATCPAKREADLAAVFDGPAPSIDEFPSTELPPVTQASDAQWLAALLTRADEIEDFLKSVRAEVERRLLAGEQVPGYKVVAGKQGNRKWGDEKAAEAMLKSFRLRQEDMYDMTLISPTAAEKLAPKVDKKTGRVKDGQADTPIGARQWTKLEALITRAPAKPHVAPDSDPRAALEIRPAIDEFESVEIDVNSLV